MTIIICTTKGCGYRVKIPARPDNDNDIKLVHKTRCPKCDKYSLEFAIGVTADEFKKTKAVT